MAITVNLIKRSEQASPLSAAQYDANLEAIQVGFASASTGSGSGTVTSVGLTGISGIVTVTGTSPITASGTFALSFNTQIANRVFAGPSSAGPSVPTFRSLVIADLPTITVAKGGTNLTAVGTAYQILRTNSGATGLEYATVTAGSTKLTVANSAGALTLDVDPTVIAITDLTGVLAISHGGTGASTAQTARLALLPSITANALKVLRVNAGATDVEWATASGGIASINADTTSAQTVL